MIIEYAHLRDSYTFLAMNKLNIYARTDLLNEITYI